MKKRFSLFLAAILVALCVASVAYVLRSKHPPSAGISLRIPDTQFMGILPLYVAEEKGFFRRQGLNIQWLDVRDPGQAGKVFFAGQADFLMSTFANILPAEARQPGTVQLLYPIFESQEMPGSFILVKPESSISTVERLRGKTVGTYSGPSQKAYALIALQRLGLSEPKDVRLVQVASSAQVQGLFSGSFDALFTVEPYASTAISRGARPIVSAVRTQFISNPFWLGSGAMNTDFTHQHPDVASRMLASLAEAAAYIRANEAEAREILSRRTGIDRPVALRCALYTWVPHPTATDLAQIQEHVDLLVKEKLLDRRVLVKDLFEGSKSE